MYKEYPRIKILKETPFDRVGTELDISSFRSKYGWICTTSTTNDQLIVYLQDWSKYPKTNNTINVSEWFEVVQYDTESLPNDFIIEGMLYTKEFDGMFHLRIPGTSRFKCDGTRQDGIQRISIREAEILLNEAKFKKHILWCTNDVNKKV